MTTDTAGLVVLVLLGAALVAAAVGWTAAGRAVWVPSSVALLAATTITAAAAPEVEVAGRGGTTLLVVLAGAVAVVGGGPLTSLVFAWVDRQDHPATGDQQPIHTAGSVLRGGAWIGALERTAVFASLVGGLTEGLAIALAVKGLGRYPELRSGASAGAAERFIIGTFTSVLWACACAGVVWLVGTG
ncbi:hypothetical protein [Nocardioides lianchengensis]|uniref:Uncharacterized protein n=1 Tax=Nocardioides lianchengensis TaxID=1045774 RepID=A0A1G6N1K3_9ACTN|nr:hypothetical protein [Nocardioides lianchengensis]NYG10620.1 hypothetical protein [Nocardioides lianchengensis]SDC61581.1 hypothetical protein SAMN05421872_103104 [Nocardioides lianchengensis]